MKLRNVIPGEFQKVSIITFFHSALLSMHHFSIHVLPLLLPFPFSSQAKKVLEPVRLSAGKLRAPH